MIANMKRIVLAIIFASVALSLSAATLKLFELDHPVYNEVESLYVLEGKASPLGAKPWSEVDVDHLISAITPTSVYTTDLKNKINSYIERDKDTGFIFDAIINPELIVHTNKDSFTKGEDFVKRDLLDKPFATLGFGTYYKNNVALYMDASLTVAPYDANNGTLAKRFSSIYGTNIPFLPDGINIMNVPYNAYFALGFDALRFVAGRGEAEWGNGVMGNMMLGNTLPYHDYLSLTYTGSRNFSYQLLASFFSHSVNEGKSDRDNQAGLRFFLGHRFEFSFFDSKLLLAVNDGVMYQSESGYLDPRLLNPMFFLHNCFIAGNSNSLLTIEAEYGIMKGLTVYGQLAIDDWAVKGEPKPGESGGSANGIGAMAGLRFDKGKLYGNAEFVFTSPYMYHRAMDGYSRELYYMSSMRYKTGGTIHLTNRYLSFPFGSDALVGQLQLGYRNLNTFDVKGIASFMAHGIMDINSTIREYNDGEKIVHTPSTSNPLAQDPAKENKDGLIEYTLTLGAECEYKVLPYLPINAGVYLITIWNKDNSNVPVSFDMQFNLGFKLIH